MVALWAVLSGLGIAGLGVVSLWGGRARPWGALPLGLFALAWGFHIAFGNASRIVASANLATELLLASLVALFPLPYFLVEFGRVHAGREGRSGRWQAVRLGTGALAMVAAITFAIEPALFLVAVTEGPYGITANWGPLWTGLQFLLFAGFGVALLALSRGVESAKTPRLEHRSTVLAMGLALYVAYAAGHNLAYYATWVATWGVVGDNVPFTLLFAALTLLVLGLIRRAWSRAQAARDPVARRSAWLLLITLAAPLAWGLVEGWVVFTQAPRLDTTGIWRLAGVGVVTYGIVRWRVFDLPQRAQRATACGLGATGALAGGATTFGLVGLVTTTAAVPLLAGGLATTLGLAPAIRSARRWLGVSGDDDPSATDDRYGQRVDAYRAALEASIARGTLEEDEPFLESLRERFGLGEEADQVLRHLAQEAIVLPSDRTVEGTFERLRLLGEGGAGRTWLARDHARDRLVALKEPLARWETGTDLEERVLEEARAAARVDHPNVVRVHEVVDDGLPVIVMEYLDGGSLEDLLRDQGVLRWQRAVSILVDVLSGMAALHGAGLIHRDVKPANILLTGDGRAKVADLGIADRPAGGDTVIEAPASTPGTPMYMAPEVQAGRGHTQRSDVYSCGALLHELLRGAPPTRAPRVTVDNEIPQPLLTILATATANDPEDRYGSAAAFLTALEEVQHT